MPASSRRSARSIICGTRPKRRRIWKPDAISAALFSNLDQQISRDGFIKSSPLGAIARTSRYEKAPDQHYPDDPAPLRSLEDPTYQWDYTRAAFQSSIKVLFGSFLKPPLLLEPDSIPPNDPATGSPPGKTRIYAHHF